VFHVEHSLTDRVQHFAVCIQRLDPIGMRTHRRAGSLQAQRIEQHLREHPWPSRRRFYSFANRPGCSAAHRMRASNPIQATRLCRCNWLDFVLVAMVVRQRPLPRTGPLRLGERPVFRFCQRAPLRDPRLMPGVVIVLRTSAHPSRPRCSPRTARLKRYQVTRPSRLAQQLKRQRLLHSLTVHLDVSRP